MDSLFPLDKSVMTAAGDQQRSVTIDNDIWTLLPLKSSRRNDIGPPCHSVCHPAVLNDVKFFFDVMTESQFPQVFDIPFTRD